MNRSNNLAHKKVVSLDKAASLAFQVPAMSREKVERLIERVQDGKYSETELVNLYDNANERGVSSVMDAIKLKMRAEFPRAATRKFGPKEEKAQTRSAEVL
jgi:hypothetical protein